MPVEGHPDGFTPYWVLDGNDKMWCRAYHNGTWWKVGDLVLTNVICYVPVPGAPDEVRPLAYPENKPSEEGLYIAHNRPLDNWTALAWFEESVVEWCDWIIDYYIPIRLDKEEDVSNVIWASGLGTLVLYRKADGSCYLKVMNGEDVLSPIPILGAELSRLHEALDDYYANREPEIAPCPNPECGEEVGWETDGMNEAYWLTCECGYSSPTANSTAEAIRLHNNLAGRE